MQRCNGEPPGVKFINQTSIHSDHTLHSQAVPRVTLAQTLDNLDKRPVSPVVFFCMGERVACGRVELSAQVPSSALLWDASKVARGDHPAALTLASFIHHLQPSHLPEPSPSLSPTRLRPFSFFSPPRSRPPQRALDVGRWNKKYCRTAPSPPIPPTSICPLRAETSHNPHEHHTSLDLSRPLPQPLQSLEDHLPRSIFPIGTSFLALHAYRLHLHSRPSSTSQHLTSPQTRVDYRAHSLSRSNVPPHNACTEYHNYPPYPPN